MLESIFAIPLSDIKPNDFGLRRLHEATVKELAESIMACGLLHPIMVKPSNGSYELVFGLHRLEACKSLGWETIPAFVRDISSEEAFIAALVENIQRNIRINIIAEARGYKRLMAKGWTPRDIARKIGKSDCYVYDRLRVLDKLHPTIQRQLNTHVCTQSITPSHAERLALIGDPQLQLKLVKLIRENNLSVRQLEYLTRKIQLSMPEDCICKECPNYPCKYIPRTGQLKQIAKRIGLRKNIRDI
jgi:ParB family chromosome partitioning protein